jgi:hypothetical protein
MPGDITSMLMDDKLSIDEIEARITGKTKIGQPMTETEADVFLITGEAPKKDAHLWARHPDDWYIEPEWASTRLFETVSFEGTIVDPACGSGRIVRAARAHRDRVKPLGDTRVTKALGYDIVKRGPECHDDLEDFLTSDYETDNIVSNPPFGLCGKASAKNGLKEDFAFVKRVLATAERKVALLLPLPWMTGADKGRWLAQTPLAQVLVLTPRPSMPPGPVIEAGEDPGGGTEDFAWYVWDRQHKGPPVLGWLNRDG